jgi:hypothetical protein
MFKHIEKRVEQIVISIIELYRVRKIYVQIHRNKTNSHLYHRIREKEKCMLTHGETKQIVIYIMEIERKKNVCSFTEKQNK